MSELTTRSSVGRATIDDPGFRQGILAVLALAPGVTVFAVAFAVSAGAAGFTPVEVVALSMLVFAGAAQVSIVALAGAGANPLVIIATAVALNLRFLMYGLSLGRLFGRLSFFRQLPIAFLLTDESFGITLREYARGRGTSGVALGSGIALYTIYVSSTVLGVVAGGAIPIPKAIDLGFIFPLMFLALLIPLIRRREHLAMALVAGLLATVFGALLPGGLVVLLVIVVTSLGWAGVPPRLAGDAVR